MSHYDVYQLGLMPPWLQNPVGENWATAFGIMKDAFAEAALRAVKAHFLQTCPEDALPLIGAERSLGQLPTETAGQYRARLLNAWSAWQYAGTKTGLAAQIALLNLPSVLIYENTDWAQPAGEWWNFWIIVQQPHPFAAFFCGAGLVCGTGLICGPTPAALYAALVNTIRTWRPAHAKLANFSIIFSGLICGLTTVLSGGSGTCGGNGYNVTF